MSKKKKPSGTPATPAASQPVPAEKHTEMTAPTAAAPAEDNSWKKIWMFSLVAVLVLMTVLSFWYGISGDEPDMSAYGKAILHYFTSFGADKTALDPPQSFDRDGVLEYYGGFFDLLAAIITKISPLAEYTTRHILNAWAGFLTILFSAKICRRIGGSRMATICVWLMFLAPFFLGHAMNNPKDIPFAAAYIAAIYYFMRFYSRLPQVTWKDYIAPALTLAIAIDIRVAGILLIPYMVVYHFLMQLWGKEDKRPAGKAFKGIAIITVTGYLGASLFWPYAQQNPISNPLNALSMLSDFQISLMQLYDGHRILSTELPAGFLPWSFIITNPYVVLAGLLLFIIGLWNVRGNKTFAGALFIAFITVFPLVYIIYKGSNVYHAWRHVLFIFPGAAIMAAFGWERLLAAARSMPVRYAITGLLILGLLEPLVFTARSFPNTITYYNAFAGGVKHGYYNYETDYYYNSLKPACDWFIKNELPKAKNDTIIIASNAAHIVGKYFESYPKVQVVYVRFGERSTKKWDYAIFHRALITDAMLKSGGWVISGTIHEEQVDGLPLCIVAKRLSLKDYDGFAQLQGGNTEQAIASFRAYNLADSSNEMVNGILAKYYMSMSQPDVAAAYVARVLKVSPDDPEATIIKGQILIGKGQAGAAVQLYDGLIEAYPEAMELHFYKAQALQAAGRADQAINEYNMASGVPSLSAACAQAIQQIRSGQQSPGGNAPVQMPQ